MFFVNGGWWIYDDGESMDVLYIHNATIRKVGCYTLLSGFQPSWPLPCYLYKTMSFVDSLYELALASTLWNHRESIAWLISNGPRSATYCYKLGPNPVKAECLCPQKAATIFQHVRAIAHCAWPRPPTTKDMKTLVMHGGFLPSSLPRFHCVGSARSAHAVPTQCPRNATTWPKNNPESSRKHQQPSRSLQETPAIIKSP